MDVFAPDAAIPDALSRALLACGDAAPELVRAAEAAEAASRSPGQDAPRAGGEGLADLARDLRLAAWEADPLDAGLAGPVLVRDAARPFLDEARRRALRLVVERGQPPADPRYLTRLLERRAHDKALAYLFDRLRDEPANLFYARQAAALALAGGDFAAADRVASHLRFVAAGVMAPVGFAADLIDADAAFLNRDFELVRRRLAAVMEHVPLFRLAARQAEAALRLGDRGLAVRLLQRDFAASPWSVATLLRLHDLSRGLDRVTAPLSGGLAILLYTCGKADDLDRTLAGLSRADLSFAPGCRLVVLDNGSADATPDVISAWTDRLGGDRLERVDLPVNIGAPAARNWLRRHPTVREAAHVAYLDDDADVPADFLGRLGAAVQAFPKAGIYGCRVVDAANPAHVQSADLFIEPLPGTGDGEAFSRSFVPSRTHLHALDMGRFDYLRPCASVTGCCHLFAAAALDRIGDFDIRLSPSQYDDLDHDFRALLAGFVPVYQGHLRVAHRKRTGSQGRPGGSQYALGFANQFKLHQFYSGEQFGAMAQAAFQAARLDAAAKWMWSREHLDLDDAGPGGRRP